MIFLDLTPKAKATIVKINKWDYIKLKSFYAVKETIKSQLTEWEKLVANHITIHGYIKIYKVLIQLDSRKPNNPVKQWVENLNRPFSNKDIQMAYEKVFYITNHKGNANESHNESVEF